MAEAADSAEVETECEAEEETDETSDYASTTEISSSESSRDSGNSQVAMLLSRLKRPTASDLARKRRLQTNCPPIGRKKSYFEKNGRKEKKIGKI